MNPPEIKSAEEFRWTRIVSPQHLTEFYETILPLVREAARQHGYTLAVHGSMKRDLDLIAVPWIAEHSGIQSLCKAIHKAACGLVQPEYQICTDKPCGRLTTMFPICWVDYQDAPKNGTGHIDLSIVPSDVAIWNAAIDEAIEVVMNKSPMPTTHNITFTEKRAVICKAILNLKRKE